MQDSITLRYTDGKMAVLNATALSECDKNGVIYGPKGYIVVENINNPQRITVYEPDRDAPRVRKDIVVPKQITGYEYQVLDCMEAINAGKLECDAMPHEETIRIMRQMDSIRKQWGLEFPCE